MTERDELYLIHILDSIHRIQRYTEGRKEVFVQSTMVQDAVLRNLQTLSESARKLSEEARLLHPEVDWRGAFAFRNKVVHDYMEIRVETVWNIIEKHLPPLLAAVEHLITLLPLEE